LGRGQILYFCYYVTGGPHDTTAHELVHVAPAIKWARYRTLHNAPALSLRQSIQEVLDLLVHARMMTKDDHFFA
jgi:hypothetical protein